MSQDFELGYVGIESTRIAEWRALAEALGFGVQEDDESNDLLLRMDGQHHRFAVQPGDREALTYVGWDVRTDDALDAVLGRLEGTGWVAKEGGEELCVQRRVRRLAVVEDPGGIRHELFTGPLVRPKPFAPLRPMVGSFVTGDQGLGHVVLATPDLGVARRFFADGIGFRKSDAAGAGPLQMDFYHCNRRHHSLACLEVPGMTGLQHVMVEVSDIDDVGIALDLVEQAGMPISITLGRHHNDRMISFYVRTPSGFDLEYGWGARAVDDGNWAVAQYDEASLWGHKFDPANLGGALHPVG